MCVIQLSLGCYRAREERKSRKINKLLSFLLRRQLCSIAVFGGRRERSGPGDSQLHPHPIRQRWRYFLKSIFTPKSPSITFETNDLLRLSLVFWWVVFWHFNPKANKRGSFIFKSCTDKHTAIQFRTNKKVLRAITFVGDRRKANLLHAIDGENVYSRRGLESDTLRRRITVNICVIKSVT